MFVAYNELQLYHAVYTCNIQYAVLDLRTMYYVVNTVYFINVCVFMITMYLLWLLYIHFLDYITPSKRLLSNSPKWKCVKRKEKQRKSSFALIYIVCIYFLKDILE